MSKTFRPWTIDQPLLLPASVQDFVGVDHLVRFVLALVLEHLDLGEIEARRVDAVAIGIKQQHRHHRRIKRRLPALARVSRVMEDHIQEHREETVRKSGGSSPTTLMKSTRSRAALAIRR
jgi:hypothetical protein